MKTRATIAAFLLVSLVVIPGLASAQSSGQPNQATTSSSVVRRGEPMTITGQVFKTGTSGTGLVASSPQVVGHGVADSDGVITITFRVPSNLANGQHTASIQGTGVNGRPLTVSTSFVISGGVLTATGSNTYPWLIVGVAVVGFGGALLGLGRKRST